MDNIKFSLFYDVEKGICTTVPIGVINLKRLWDIYTSPKVKDITERIKIAQGEEKQKLKKQLPFITPYGTFTPSRANINLTHHNKRLIALDIDGLTNEEVRIIKFTLISQAATLLCAISPRGNGIKALIIISDVIPLEDHYNTLKLNKSHIAESLGILEFESKIDIAQFKLSQPWFIAYDEELYLNENAESLDIELIEYNDPVYLDVPVDFNLITEIREKTKYLEPINHRINVYFERSVNGLIKFFAGCSEGNRHSSIIKVQTIASWIHYAPQIEIEVKEKLLDACIGMYGSHQIAKDNNVINSFNEAWDKAPIRRNETIESILSDSKYRGS
jgi:hypothetical protein